MLEATVVECIPISATVSNDGACNNEFMIYYEGTTVRRRTWHSLYLLVLGWTAIHPLPSNILLNFSRGSLWTKSLTNHVLQKV